MEKIREIIKGETPVLIDCFATWCSPCKMMEPVVKSVKTNYGDAVRILKIDIDQSPEFARAMNVQSVPTFILFQGGKVLWRRSGAMPENILQAELDPFLKKL